MFPKSIMSNEELCAKQEEITKINKLIQCFNDFVLGLKNDSILSRVDNVGKGTLSCLQSELLNGEDESFLKWFSKFKRNPIWNHQITESGTIITIYGSKSDPTIEIKNAPIKKHAIIKYSKILLVSSIGEDTDKKRLRVDRKIKDSYKKSRVSLIYSSLEFNQIEEQLKNLWERNNFAPNIENSEKLRIEIFNKFLLNILKFIDTDLSRKLKEIKNDIGDKVLTSVRSALKALSSISNGNIRKKSKTQRSEKKQYAYNIVAKGATWKSDLSKSEIEYHLGISRLAKILVHNNNKNHDQETNVENIVENNSSRSDEENVNKELFPPEKIINSSSNNSINNSSDNYSDSDYQTPEESSDDDNGSIDESDLSDCFFGFEIKRKQRKDTRSLAVVRSFWHCMCQYNTNSSTEKQVLNNDDPTNPFFESHRELLQSEPTRLLYKKFVISQAYLDYLFYNPEMFIGYTLFKQAKCKCIKWDRLRKCADTREVQMDEYFKAFCRLRRNNKKEIEKCLCVKCQDPKYLNAFNSKQSFMDYVLCPAENYPLVSRTSKHLITKEKKAEQLVEVLSEMNDKLKKKMKKENKSSLNEMDVRKIKKENIRPSISMSTHIQQETLTIFKKTCCNSLCLDNACGIKRNLQELICPVEMSNKFITFRKYANQVVTDADGDDYEKQNKELKMFCYAYPIFVEEFYEFLYEYFPHYHVARWNNYMIKLLFDSIIAAPLPPPEYNNNNDDWEDIFFSIICKTLYIQCDFSAIMKLIGQDGGTCEQPKQAIQEV